MVIFHFMIMVVLTITVQQRVLGKLGVNRKRKESEVGEAVRSPEIETHKLDCTHDRPLVP